MSYVFVNIIYILFINLFVSDTTPYCFNVYYIDGHFIYLHLRHSTIPYDDMSYLYTISP